MWLRSMWELFRTINFADVLDLAVIASLLYLVLLWFKRTKAAFVARGIFIFAIVYAIAQQAGMYLTTWLFQGFFAIFLIALVVIFQEELRSFFERLAVWSLRRRATHPFQPRQVEILVRTAGELARGRIGALIVVKGRDPLVRHMEGGEDLDGVLSGALLMSLFDPHSDGHDGAVVIEEARVTHFGAHLPLSKEFGQLTGMGTRHAAALGLSERADALCLVVSEERGVISVAREGQIRPVGSLEELEDQLIAFFQEKSPVRLEALWRDVLRRNAAEKAIAVGIALVLWLVFVQGYRPASETFRIPVKAVAVPAGLELVAVRPSQINVTLKGLKRDLKLFNPLSVRAFINLKGAAPGVHRLTLSDENLQVPGALQLSVIDPSAVEVELEAPSALEPSKKSLRLFGIDLQKPIGSASSEPHETPSGE